MPFRLAFLLLVAIPPSLLHLADAQEAQSTSTAGRWEVVEFKFKLPNEVDQPFAVEFGAVFQHSEGDRLQIPGFFNGDGRWLLRFCPDKLGEWSYTTYSSEPELAGKTGGIEVIENQRTWQHGPIEVSASDPQRFVYADGSPYFLMAFELDWLFALDAENDDEIPRTREIVSTVADSGFNQLVMNVFAYNAPWGEKDKIRAEHNFAKPRVYPFDPPNG